MVANYNFSEEELLRLEESFQAECEYEYQQNYEYKEPEPLGDVFTLEDFIKAVHYGCFTDYDGIGYLSLDGVQEQDVVECNVNWLNDKLADGYFKYVIWFNK